MKKKRIVAAVGIMAIASVLTGAYALFTDMERLSIHAKASNLSIKVDYEQFSDFIVRDMVPGDSRDLSYTISNTGDADVQVFSEITITSTVPMSDTVEWFIQDLNGSVTDEDRQVDPDFQGEEFVDDISIEEIQENDIKFISLTDDHKVAKFLVNNGVLHAYSNEKSDVELKLMLGLNAGNEFMDSTCDVVAEVYGIQTKNVDETLTWEFIKDTAFANEKAEIIGS
jgi:hypothetical protein